MSMIQVQNKTWVLRSKGVFVSATKDMDTKHG